MKREYVILSVKSHKRFNKSLIKEDGSALELISVEKAELSILEKFEEEKNENNIAIIENLPFKVHQENDTQTFNSDASWFFDYCNLTDDLKWSGKGVKVGIIDSGIHRDHHVFEDKENPIIFTTKNFVNPTDDVADKTGHGTVCSSIIFGRNYFDEGLRTEYRIGVAKGITDVYIAKVSNTPYNYRVSNVVEAIIWLALQKVDIVNMSFGITFTDYLKIYDQDNNIDTYELSKAQWSFSQFVQSFNKILDLIAKKSSITFIASSGNDSNRQNYIDRSIFCGIPAIVSECLSIGSLDYHASSNSCTINHNSNAGVDYVGPNKALALSKVGTNFELKAKTGTSIASPYLTGFAALMIEKICSENNGTYTRRELINLINANCDSLNFRKNKAPLFGRGLPVIKNN